MKKIIILTENYVEGGLDTFISDLVTGLRDTFQIDFICNASHPGLVRIKKHIPPDVNVITYKFLINSPYYRGVCFNRLTRSGIGKYLLKLTRKLIAYPFCLYMIIYWMFYFRAYHSMKLIVVNGGYPGGLVCRAAGIAWYLSKGKKVIYSIHNFRESIPLYRIPFEVFFDILTVFSAKNLITVSNTTKHSLDSNPVFKRMNAPTSFIYNGSRTPSKLTEFYQKPFKDRQYFTVLASYEPRKGYDDLIHACHLLKQNKIYVQIKCFGHIHNDYHASLRAQVKRLGLEKYISLNPFSLNVEEILAGTRALIVPSKAYESFGLVAVESFLRNVPVIAYRMGGLVEVVSEEVGLLVDIGDIKGLASAIQTLFSDEQAWLRLSSKTHNYAIARFSLNRMTEEYERVLGKVQ